jgi:3-hydroxyisobutyrate dehydrogenase-like beta-hydroxyacid dehydrogenase
MSSARLRVSDAHDRYRAAADELAAAEAEAAAAAAEAVAQAEQFSATLPHGSSKQKADLQMRQLAQVGFGRIVALYYSSSTSHQIC